MKITKIVIIDMLVSLVEIKMRRGSLIFSAISGKIVRIDIDTSKGIIPTFRRVVGSPVGSHVLRVCGGKNSDIRVNAPVLGLSLRDARARCRGLLSRRRVHHCGLSRLHIGDRAGLSSVTVRVGISTVGLDQVGIRLQGRRCLSDLKTKAASGIHRTRLDCGITRLRCRRLRRRFGGRRRITTTRLGIRRLSFGVFHGDLTRVGHAFRSTRVHSPQGTVLAFVGGRVNTRVSRNRRITIVSSLDRFGIRNRVTSACNSHISTKKGTVIGVNDSGLRKAIDDIAPLSGGKIVSFDMRLGRSGRHHLHSKLGASICIVGTIGRSIVHVTGNSFCIKHNRCRLFIYSSSDRLIGHGMRLNSSGFRCMRILDKLGLNSEMIIDSVGSCGGGGGLGLGWNEECNYRNVFRADIRLGRTRSTFRRTLCYEGESFCHCSGNGDCYMLYTINSYLSKSRRSTCVNNRVHWGSGQ